MVDTLFVSQRRVEARKERVLALVDITDDGHNLVRDIMPAASESVEACSTVLRRLKGCDLQVTTYAWSLAAGVQVLAESRR